ncbi:MAG: biopolymer transporter ExbD [Thermoguttaceae bacterium]
MAGKFSNDVKAEPNLTPMLDMVFQLITFFVLVINFRSAEIDFTLNLPVVGSARPVETGGRTGLLVLNIDAAGNLRTTRTIADIDNFLKIQSQAAMLANRLTPDDIERGTELPTTVVIRADRETPFGKINRVIRACQDNGFRSFALKAKVNKDG